MIKTMEMTETSDAHLVAESLTGNRDAFGQIVARYQNLVCSLAYSATGNLNQSEDLAQETFLAAWKQLAGLREPQKLRSWLCGIARNLTYDSLKKQGREPSHAGESLDTLEASPPPNRCRTISPSARRKPPSSGVPSSAFRRFTANRSSCFIASINPSKPSRKIWS